MSNTSIIEIFSLMDKRIKFNEKDFYKKDFYKEEIKQIIWQIE
ncbi:MAG: hypothetical protein ACK5LT_06300 [Lachnospirales bacterium]